MIVEGCGLPLFVSKIMMPHHGNRMTETVYALSISCLGPNLIFQWILIMYLQLILAKRMLIVVMLALWQGFNELNDIQEQLSRRW